VTEWLTDDPEGMCLTDGVRAEAEMAGLANGRSGGRSLTLAVPLAAE
jgi:hypothetical protein